MKNTGLLIFISFFLPFILTGQDLKIQGKILNQGNQELEAATVVLITAKDSLYKGFTLTGSDGKFLLSNLDEGDYVLQISYLGYKQSNKTVELSESKDVGTIILEADAQLIDDVEVVGERVPVIAKKDTIIYNADAFETQPNDVVEDLLRQMPGVEVEDDGTIIAQGEEVSQVTVDGREFFGDDPKIATKNLPAQAIDKVEFFDKKSDASEFSGVDDGERIKTMNLELKEDYKAGSFGNLSAGYGTDSRYEGKVALNRFNKNLQLSVLGNLNNINQQGFSFREYANFSGNFRGGNGNNVNNGRSSGFVDTRSFGVNGNYQINRKSKVNFNYFYNGVDKTLDQLTTRDYVFNRAETFLTNDTVGILNGNENHRLRLRYEAEIDSSQDIRITSSYEFTTANQSSLENSNTILSDGTLSNQQIRDASEEAIQSEIAGQLTYRKKFGTIKKRIVTLDANINSGADDLEGLADSESTFFDSNTGQLVNLLLQEQLQTNDQLDYRANLSYVEPLGGNKYLEFVYRRSNFHTDLDRDVFDLETGTATVNDLLSNEYVRDFGFDRVGMGFYANDETTSLSLEGNIQYSRLNGSFTDSNMDINRDNLAFLPRLSLRKEFGQGHNLRLRYNTSVNLPSITQLQPFEDNSDPLNIYVGNPDLQAEYSHRLRINYINFDQFNLTSLFAFFNINYTRNKLVNRTLINQDFVRVTSPTNVTDDLSVSGRVSRGLPLRKLGMKLRINTNVLYGNSIVFVNDVRNDASTYRGGLGFTIENRSKGKFNLSYTPNVNYTLSTFSEASENNLSYYDHQHRIDFDLYTIKKWALGSDFNLTYYSAQDFGEAQIIPIWSANVSRYFMPGDRLEIQLSIFDILNQNEGVTRSTNLNYIQNRVINSLGRYAMLGVTYRLQDLGSESSGFGGGRGGPERGGRF